MDYDLPQMEYDRSNFRRLMGGILTSTYRKFESFLTSHLKLTVKFLTMNQIKRLGLLLINLKVYLSPNSVETFHKFMRITYGLGDVVVSKD